MYYAIRHQTTFHYSEPISESVMEVRMQPRSESQQRCLNFNLHLIPKARLSSYTDYLGNIVHTFDIPEQHKKLTVLAESTVELRPTAPLPPALAVDEWDALDAQIISKDYYDLILPSHFARPSEMLDHFAAELNWLRRGDPLSLLRELNTAIYNSFEYEQNVTEVDSPIEQILRIRQGVCQDFAHVMITLLRGLGIPARYISGYLFHNRTNGEGDRSAVDASHAWVEAWLPSTGWIGFDPTNNLICADRHIRVGIGRDYADVSPTRGVFKGSAETKLAVLVKVSLLEDLPMGEIPSAAPLYDPEAEDAQDQLTYAEEQQQQ